MSHPQPVSLPRPKRTIFHYKIDADLREEDRSAYLALIVDPQTTNQSAHAWLRERGYQLSLSAVARHRRRRIAGDAERERQHREMMTLARYLSGPNAPDFARATMLQFQQLVFNLLLQSSRGRTEREEPQEQYVDARENDEIAKLGQFCKLVHACVKMTATQVRQDLQKDKDLEQPNPPRDDETLRRDIEEILSQRRPPMRKQE